MTVSVFRISIFVCHRVNLKWAFVRKIQKLSFSKYFVYNKRIFGISQFETFQKEFVTIRNISLFITIIDTFHCWNYFLTNSPFQLYHRREFFFNAIVFICVWLILNSPSKKVVLAIDTPKSFYSNPYIHILIICPIFLYFNIHSLFNFHMPYISKMVNQHALRHFQQCFIEGD